MTLISIITPVFNAEKYLQETITSVLMQTYNNWEWILVDDCSTDNSYEILKKYAEIEPRIKLFKNEVNSKTFATRNKALEESKGYFIAFLDADDCWIPDKLELQIKFMLENNIAICYTNIRQFNKQISHENKLCIFPEKARYKDILTNNFIVTSSVLINKKLTGAFYMRNVYYDDFTLWLELLKNIPSARNLNLVTTNYRLSENSLSRNKINSAKKVYDIFTKQLGFRYIKARILFVKWAVNTSIRYLKK